MNSIMTSCRVYRSMSLGNIRDTCRRGLSSSSGRTILPTTSAVYYHHNYFDSKKSTNDFFTVDKKRRYSNGPGYAIPSPSIRFDDSKVMVMVKIIPAKLKNTKGFVSTASTGRLLLEFFPKDSSNTQSIRWNDKWTMALSPREVGSLVAPQGIPPKGVEIVRRQGAGEVGRSSFTKSLTVAPSNDGGEEGTDAVDFTLAYVDDPTEGDDGYTLKQKDEPRTITLQAGEFQMLRCLLERCVPHLLGFDALMEMQRDFMMKNVDVVEGYDSRNNTANSGEYYQSNRREADNASPNISSGGPQGNTTFF